MHFHLIFGNVSKKQSRQSLLSLPPHPVSSKYAFTVLGVSAWITCRMSVMLAPSTMATIAKQYKQYFHPNKVASRFLASSERSGGHGIAQKACGTGHKQNQKENTFIIKNMPKRLVGKSTRYIAHSTPNLHTFFLSLNPCNYKRCHFATQLPQSMS